MWKGIKGGRKSDRQPLLRNGRAGRWVAFKLSVFSRFNVFFFFLFKLPSTLHIWKPWTLPLFFFFFQTGLNVRFFFFFPLSFPLHYIFQNPKRNISKPRTHSFFFSFFLFSNRLERLIFLISFSFKLNWKGFGLDLIVELNK